MQIVYSLCWNILYKQIDVDSQNMMGDHKGPNSSGACQIRQFSYDTLVFQLQKIN